MLACVLVFVCPVAAENYTADNGVGAGAGESFGGSSSISHYRALLRVDFLEPRTLGQNWLLQGALEFSLAYWQTDVPERKNYSDGSTDTMVGAVSPVFRLSAPGYWQHSWQPYLEAGIGGAWFQHKKLAAYSYEEGDLGSHLQFEDRISLGICFSRWRDISLSFSVIHYSNANLGDANDGINLRQLSLSVPF